MNNTQQHINHLWHQFANKQASTEELDELFHFLQQSEHEEASRLFLEQYFAGSSSSETIDREYWMKRLGDVIKEGRPAQTVHRVHFLKTAWFRYAAAAVLIAGGALGYGILKQVQHDNLVANDNKHLQSDIAPGSEKAVLTLADGSTIILDNAQNGNLTQQGSTKIIKLDKGQLAYTALEGNNRHPELDRRHPELVSGPTLYNTISTPRGGRYQIVLPDGSNVWLNAASSIKFPTAFVGAERTVTVSGEVYMEIAKSSKQPFIVKVDGAEIRVLGTSFNINAYGDESSIKTTLVEGSVKVKTGNDEAVLKPGQQAVVASSVRQLKVENADITDVLAWKNGLFLMNGTSVIDMLKQVERWYDVDVIYEGEAPMRRLGGNLSRNVPVSEVLKILELYGVRSRVEGKRIIIMP